MSSSGGAPPDWGCRHTGKSPPPGGDLTQPVAADLCLLPGVGGGHSGIRSLLPTKLCSAFRKSSLHLPPNKWIDLMGTKNEFQSRLSSSARHPDRSLPALSGDLKTILLLELSPRPTGPEPWAAAGGGAQGRSVEPPATPWVHFQVAASALRQSASKITVWKIPLLGSTVGFFCISEAFSLYL